MPEPRRVQCRGAAHPEVRPEHRPSLPHRTAPADRQLHLLRHAGEAARGSSPSRTSGARAGAARGERVAQALGEGVAGAVAPRLREREPARGQHHAVRGDRPLARLQPEARGLARAIAVHPVPRSRSRHRVFSASPTRAASTVRARFESGKSLPSSSSCRETPISRKKSTAASAGKALRTRRTTLPVSSAEVALGDHAVRDVAAPAPADEDLGPELNSPFEGHDGPGGAPAGPRRSRWRARPPPPPPRRSRAGSGTRNR